MKRNILITGGELFNKGAQAMTFVTVSELSKRFPDKQIILVSGRDNSRPQAEKDRYCFSKYRKYYKTNERKICFFRTKRSGYFW